MRPPARPGTGRAWSRCRETARAASGSSRPRRRPRPRRRRARRRPRSRSGSWTRGEPLWVRSKRGRRPGAVAGGRAVYRGGRRERLLPRNPEPAGGLRRLRSLRRVGCRGLPARALRVEHLQPRQRVPDRPELCAVTRLDDRQQRAGALDRLVDLLEVGLRRRLALRGRRAGQPGLARAEVEEAHDRLQQHVVDRDLLHLGLEGAQLLLAELGLLGAHVTVSSCWYVLCVSFTHSAYTTTGQATESIRRRW